MSRQGRHTIAAFGILFGVSVWTLQPLAQALPRVPWLFMNARDWGFVLQRLVLDRLRGRVGVSATRPTDPAR